MDKDAPSCCRAHRLTDHGVIDTTTATFERSLTYGNAEAQQWIPSRLPVRIGFAAFTDVARAFRRAGSEGAGPLQVDIGGGLRVRLPKVARTLRVDVAHGLRDGANALTFGWQF